MEAPTDLVSENARLTPHIAPTPNDPPWNGWVALGIWVLSVILVVFIPVIFVTPYLLRSGVNFGDNKATRMFMMTDPTAVMLQLAPILLAHGLTLAAAWFIVTRFNSFSFTETLGWKMNGFKIWHAALLTAAFYGIAIGFASAFADVENEFEVMIKSSRAAVFLVAFFATFTAPLVEEVIYRGLLYSAFQRRFGAGIALAMVTLLFTAVHVPQYSVGTAPDYATIFTLLLISLALTLVRMTTGNLLPCIVLHTIFNASQSVLLLAEPYIRSVEPVVEPSVVLLIK